LQFVIGNLARQEVLSRSCKLQIANYKLTDPPKPVIGAAPEGARGPDAAAAAVREMFTSIAPRYDLLNHVLSFNVDRLWWRRTARTFRHLLRREGARALDLCCGTGDMAFALCRVARVSGACICGADFSHAMLVRARQKAEKQVPRFARNDNRKSVCRVERNVFWLEADALRLPVAGESFDLVTSAFGFRNLADYDAGLREILRVLRPGGEAGILDFGEPGGIIGRLYRVYFRHVLPRIGTLISGVRGPYAYLPASVARFPAPAEMLERMRAAGFSEVSWTPYTFGIAGLYRGRKAMDDRRSG
jgi:demethylmenaquinone methyltransferase/2-methoxy-6-polyprenyl-1,4-benzoquinol methylase